MSATDDELQLIDDIAAFEHDPLGHVLYCYPWGQPGTELEKEAGPRTWQRELLGRIGEQLRAGEATVQGVIQEVIQEAVSSGNGIGKSAIVAWLLKWALDTFEDTRGLVTAMTKVQLTTKTVPELTKWHRLSLTESWFHMTSTALYSTDPKHEKTWRVDLIPWNEVKPEAFQGLHNKRKRVIVIFDEASGIPDSIWEAVDGACTDEDTEIIRCVFGNPTRTSGRFRECFGRDRHRWSRGAPLQIDSRAVEGTNKKLLQEWIDDHGEDSDFVRIRVRGMFPRASALQLIPTDVVAGAMKREPSFFPGDPLIMGIDVARGGDDNWCIRFRRGNDARSIPPTRIPGSESRDSMKVLAKVCDLIATHKPNAIFIDATGVGGPIGDRLRQLGHPCFDVQFGGDSPDKKHFRMRTHMWVRLGQALAANLAIDNDPILEMDLTGPEYWHNALDQMVLESKDELKERGYASPDDGDALALLYAYDVAPISGAGAGAEPSQSDISFKPHRR